MCGCDIEFTLTTAHTHFSHSKLGAPDRQRAENNRARFCDCRTTWAAGSRCEAPHMRVNIWRHRDTATWLVWCNYTYIISLRAKCTFSVAVLPPERETVRQGPLWEQGGRASSFAHCSWNLCVHKKDRLLRLEVNVRDNLLCSKGFGEALGATNTTSCAVELLARVVRTRVPGTAVGILRVFEKFTVYKVALNQRTWANDGHMYTHQ